MVAFARCPVPGARCPVPGARCPVPGARCPVPGARWLGLTGCGCCPGITRIVADPPLWLLSPLAVAPSPWSVLTAGLCCRFEPAVAWWVDSPRADVGSTGAAGARARPVMGKGTSR
ncbi:hypothetical protein E1261_44380 [Kribbella albertanoniae]|uniref:Uncharacterized protein n=1 Tax=Kribbella albertanoniae TaxID=1266829 RepID=A0A4R4NW03_9ACTN|nr:hypothetical protein E1261_44380 [Kribbella albertanoniae]